MHPTGQYRMLTQTSFKVSLFIYFFAFWITNTLAETSLGFHPHPHESSRPSPNSFKQVNNNNNKKIPSKITRNGTKCLF